MVDVGGKEVTASRPHLFDLYHKPYGKPEALWIKEKVELGGNC
jgi:hypothetical protein